MARYGLIEAGGTKFVLGLAEGTAADLAANPAAHITARHQIPTETPAETLGAAVAWFQGQGAVDGIGIASFGPLCLDRANPQWGHITSTTKPHWSNTDVAGAFSAALGCPVEIDTDVNAAALSEARWGAGRGAGATLYLTIGTGIGGGFVGADGRLLHGLSHPEMGHIRLPRHPEDMDFPGVCPFHGACLEGLAAGPSVKARWGKSLSDLPADHPGAGIIAWYLGHAIASFQAVLEPARIVLGGGVMGTPGLLDKVRAKAAKAGGGYFVGNSAEAVVLPALWPDSGLLGALGLILAQN